MFIHIAGTGSYLPEKVLSNADLTKMLDTSDEWIMSHTGIQSRHVVGDDEQTSDMAYHAAVKALESANVKPEELGGIIVATSTGDYKGFPSVACLLQGRLGCKPICAFDVTAACAGCIYAIQAARALMQFDPRPFLVVGAEAMTRAMDYTDRNVCIIFGDGAGAVVLKASDEPGGIVGEVLGSDGSANPPVIFQSGGMKKVPGDPVGGKIHMNGRAVFNFAVKIFDEMIDTMLKKESLTYDDLALVISHQANARIIEAVARRVNQPLDKFFMNIATVGNTSAASMLIALDEAARAGKLKKGDWVASVAFGAGLAYGGLLFKMW